MLSDSKTHTSITMLNFRGVNCLAQSHTEVMARMGFKQAVLTPKSDPSGPQTSRRLFWICHQLHLNSETTATKNKNIHLVTSGHLIRISQFYRILFWFSFLLMCVCFRLPTEVKAFLYFFATPDSRYTFTVLSTNIKGQWLQNIHSCSL